MTQHKHLGWAALARDFNGVGGENMADPVFAAGPADPWSAR
jgi:hypothetical protein